MRIDPFGGEAGSLSSFNGSNSNDSWLPRSIKPVDILRTHPAQITLDGFYALNRPLLQVTVPAKQRRYPSSEANKAMEVVGESEFTEEQIKAGQQDPFAEDQIGQFDLHLVTEPDGADPAWADGTDKHMASLEHNVPPSLPTTSTSSSSLPSPPTVPSKKPSKKPSPRQEAIDYLFPIQAEARKAEAEETQSPSMSPQDQSLGAEIQRLLHLEGFEVDMTEGGLHSSRLGTPSDPMAGSKFLAGQLMKHKWSGMWDWEPTRRALVAAASRSPPALSSTTSLQTKGKNTATSSNTPTPPIQTSLDKLGKFSRTQARKTARSAARRGAGSSTAAYAGLPKSGDLLTANNKEHLQEMIQQLARDPNSQGKTIFIQMPLKSDASAFSKKGKNKQRKSADQEPQDAVHKTNPAENVKPEALLGKDEVKQVLEQVKKFEGFFDKSIDAELQNKVEGKTSAATVSSPEAADNTRLAELDWASASSTAEQALSAGESQDAMSWFAEGRPSDEAINARFSSLGSRLSNTQAYRGRGLRPTLRERLALRDVELQGPYKWIGMDSVKRKRRKRISKHKYKKRRKATRAERRRIGK